jgi:RHS repeat-associated protein
MWQWDNLDPFGANTPNENPTGQGPFKYNLRFPGQYYDAETGTHYNANRDYDPTIGRYEQSDPIGLWGGVNSYGYVKQNPLNSIDELGLAVSASNVTTMPVPFPRVGIPPFCWATPAGAIVCGGLGGWWLGGIIYPIIEPGLSKIIDDVCRHNPDCNEHLTKCLHTSMADLPGSVYGSNRCLLCRDACVRGGGNWPDIAMTGSKSVRCDYWNFK